MTVFNTIKIAYENGVPCPHNSWKEIIKKYKVAFKYIYDKDGNIKILDKK